MRNFQFPLVRAPRRAHAVRALHDTWCAQANSFTSFTTTSCIPAAAAMARSPSAFVLFSVHTKHTRAHCHWQHTRACRYLLTVWQLPWFVNRALQPAAGPAEAEYDANAYETLYRLWSDPSVPREPQVPPSPHKKHAHRRVRLAVLHPLLMARCTRRRVLVHRARSMLGPSQGVLGSWVKSRGTWLGIRKTCKRALYACPRS